MQTNKIKIRNHIKQAIALFILVLAASTGVQGATVIQADEEKTTFVTVSQKDINRIELPEDIAEGLSSKAVDVKIKGSSLFVKLPDSPQPAELFVITDERTISLILVPKDIPSETIIVKEGNGNGGGQGGIALASADYEGHIKNIVLALSSGTAPDGYSEKPIQEAELVSMGNLTLKKEYGIENHVFEGAKYIIHNSGASKVVLSEDMFSGWEGVAVGLNRLELYPQETGNLFIVKRKK